MNETDKKALCEQLVTVLFPDVLKQEIKIAKVLSEDGIIDENTFSAIKNDKNKIYSLPEKTIFQIASVLNEDFGANFENISLSDNDKLQNNQADICIKNAIEYAKNQYFGVINASAVKKLVKDRKIVFKSDAVKLERVKQLSKEIEENNYFISDVIDLYCINNDSQLFDNDEIVLGNDCQFNCRVGATICWALSFVNNPMLLENTYIPIRLILLSENEEDKVLRQLYISDVPKTWFLYGNTDNSKIINSITKSETLNVLVKEIVQKRNLTTPISHGIDFMKEFIVNDNDIVTQAINVFNCYAEIINLQTVSSTILRMFTNQNVELLLYSVGLVNYLQKDNEVLKDICKFIADKSSFPPLCKSIELKKQIVKNKLEENV